MEKKKRCMLFLTLGRRRRTEAPLSCVACFSIMFASHHSPLQECMFCYNSISLENYSIYLQCMCQVLCWRTHVCIWHTRLQQVTHYAFSLNIKLMFSFASCVSALQFDNSQDRCNN